MEKKRIQEIRINESNKNERILGKQLELLQKCNGRKESMKF